MVQVIRQVQNKINKEVKILKLARKYFIQQKIIEICKAIIFIAMILGILFLLSFNVLGFELENCIADDCRIDTMMANTIIFLMSIAIIGMIIFGIYQWISSNWETAIDRARSEVK